MCLQGRHRQCLGLLLAGINLPFSLYHILCMVLLLTKSTVAKLPTGNYALLNSTKVVTYSAPDVVVAHFNATTSR